MVKVIDFFGTSSNGKNTKERIIKGRDLVRNLSQKKVVQERLDKNMVPHNMNPSSTGYRKLGYEFINEINDFQEFFRRADQVIRIRNDLSIRYAQILSSLEKNPEDKKAIDLLYSNIRVERQLLNVIENGISSMVNVLKSTDDKIRKILVADHDSKELADLLREKIEVILNFLLKNMKKISKRIKMEEEVLSGNINAKKLSSVIGRFENERRNIDVQIQNFMIKKITRLKSSSKFNRILRKIASPVSTPKRAEIVLMTRGMFGAIMGVAAPGVVQNCNIIEMHNEVDQLVNFLVNNSEETQMAGLMLLFLVYIIFMSKGAIRNQIIISRRKNLFSRVLNI